jgi:hypothetical protein
VAFAFKDDTIPDACPLTSTEKTLKAELEAVVSAGLEEFLRVGTALAELRNRRLYRTEFATFEAYCRGRFSLARSSVDQLIRSSIVARDLLDSGIELSPNTSEAVIRPLSALPGQELQAACWSLVKSLAPESQPRQPLVSKVCRIIRNLVDGDGDGDSALRRGGRQRSTVPHERELAFAGPVIRLSRWHGFNPAVVTCHIQESANARTLFSACTEMITRCRQVQQSLITRFPDMEDSSLVEHNQR